MYDDATYGEGTRNRGEEDKRRRIYDWLCTSVRISRCSFVTSSWNASGDDSRFKVVYTAMLGAEGSRREHAVITTSYPWRFTNREIQAQHKPIAIEILALNTWHPIFWCRFVLLSNKPRGEIKNCSDGKKQASNTGKLVVRPLQSTSNYLETFPIQMETFPIQTKTFFKSIGNKCWTDYGQKLNPNQNDIRNTIPDPKPLL